MKNIGIKDFMNYKYPTGVTTSPDGKHAAFAVVTVNEAENKYDSCLWSMDMDSGEYRMLTSGKSERKFIWMNNEQILFIANRDKTYAEKIKNGEEWTCFYKMNICGGEAEFAFAVPFFVTGMKLAGEKLVLTIAYDYSRPDFASMDAAERVQAAKAWKEEMDYEVFDEHPFWANGMGVVNKKRMRLAVYDVTNGKTEFVSPDYENVEKFWVEGDSILYTGNLYTDKRDQYQGLYCVSLTDGTRKTLVPQGNMRVDYACVLSGKVMFLGSDMETYGINENPELYEIENDEIHFVAEFDTSIKNSIGCDCKFVDGPAIVHDESNIYAIVTLRKQSVLAKINEEGVLTLLNDRQGSVHTVDVNGDKLYFAGARDLGLTELYSLAIGESGSEEKKLTAFNDAILAERNVCEIEEFTFCYKDVELDGYVIKPANFDPNKTYPGILTVHGGPRSTFGPVFFHESQMFANEGYFVFFTNPVGSDGRGNDFADLIGRYGTVDYDNLMAFTDEILKRYPQVDEKRLGMMGGSYGGFMANWIIGHTDRFAAVVSQRSISNWITLSMTTDIGFTFDIEQVAGDPWSNLENMWMQSPLKWAHHAKTPTLFIQSDQDYRCYMADALQMFTTLKYFGVDTRMCLFHGENHELSRAGKPKHRVRRLTEMVNWFEKYLKAE